MKLKPREPIAISSVYRSMQSVSDELMLNSTHLYFLNTGSNVADFVILDTIETQLINQLLTRNIYESK